MAYYGSKEHGTASVQAQHTHTHTHAHTVTHTSCYRSTMLTGPMSPATNTPACRWPRSPPAQGHFTTSAAGPAPSPHSPPPPPPSLSAVAAVTPAGPAARKAAASTTVVTVGVVIQIQPHKSEHKQYKQGHHTSQHQQHATYIQRATSILCAANSTNS